MSFYSGLHWIFLVYCSNKHLACSAYLQYQWSKSLCDLSDLQPFPFELPPPHGQLVILYPLQYFQFGFIFLLSFFKGRYHISELTQGRRKTINYFVEEKMNSCWGTLRNKQTCIFTCEFTPGNGGKVVSKSGLPGQKKQVHITRRIF